MIIRNNKTTSALYKGTKEIIKRYKGTLVVYEAFKNLLASGVPPLTLTKCKGVDLVDYKLYGNSVQNGTPTPTTPIEVESVGERTPNLINLLRETTEIGGNPTTAVNLDTTKVYLSYASSGYFSSNRTKNLEITKNRISFSSSYAWYGVGFPLKVEPNKQYTLSWETDCEKIRPSIGYYSKGLFLDYISITDTQKKSITTPTECDMVIISFTPSVKDEIVWAKNIQWQEGNIATEYEPYGYKIPVKTSGKNLLDIENVTLKKWNLHNNRFIFQDDSYYAINFSVSNKEIHFSSPNLLYQGLYFELESQPYERTFSISVDADIYKAVQVWSIDGSTRYATSGTDKVVVPANVDCLCAIRIDATGDYVIKDIQIEIGNVATGYEEYVEPITTNIYLDEPLRKIGDYVDYIDFENGKVVRNIHSHTLTGNEQYYLCDSNAVRTLENIIPRIKLSNPSLALFKGYLCSHNPFINNSYAYLTTYSSDNPTSFEFRNIVQNWVIPEYTIDAWTTFLKNEFAKGTPVTIDYILESSIEETIELPNIPTIKGTTILSTDTKIQPSNLEVVYKGK